MTGPADHGRLVAPGPTQQRLVACFVVAVVPMLMLFPRVGGWLMVMASIGGWVGLLRGPLPDRTEWAYLVLAAILPASYLLNMAMTGWDFSWLHRPAHLLLTGGGIFLLVGRAGLRWRALCWSVAAAAFVTLGIALFGVFCLGEDRVSGFGKRWNAVPFGNFSLLLGCLAFAAMMTELLSPRRSSLRWLVALAAALAGLSAAALTATRGSWLAFPALLLVALIAGMRACRTRRARTLLAAILLVFLGTGVVAIQTDSVRARFDRAVDEVYAGDVQDAGLPADASTRLRLEMWRWGIEQFSDHPWTGIGLANFGQARSAAVEDGHMPPEFLGLANLHNEVITSLAFGGIPMAMALFAFWGGGAWFFARRMGRRASFFFALSGLMVIVGTAMFSMTEGLFGTSAGSKAFALLLALSAGGLRYDEARRSRRAGSGLAEDRPAAAADATDGRHLAGRRATPDGTGTDA